MKIDAGHIKDLHVFLAVIEANGISNAQSMLNKDASSISRSISALENRLALKLCDRGRQGFRLTPEGRQVLDETIKLFSAFRSFENSIESIGGRGSGRLAIGVIDNIISDENCPLHRALGQLSEQFESRIHIDLYVKNPYDLEKYLIDKRIDLAIGIFENHHDSIWYQPLYEEVDYLYCSPENPVGILIKQNAGDDAIAQALNQQNFSARNFLNESDIHCLGFKVLGETSYTSNLEAIAFLVMSGKYIGFMPEHYAQRFVDNGQLIPILASRIKRTSKIELAHRVNEENTRKIISKSLNVMLNQET